MSLLQDVARHQPKALVAMIESRELRGETHIARFEARMLVPFCVEKLCRVLFFSVRRAAADGGSLLCFLFLSSLVSFFFWQNLAAKISGSRFRITLWKWSQARVFFLFFSFLFRACVCVRVLC